MGPGVADMQVLSSSRILSSFVVVGGRRFWKVIFAFFFWEREWEIQNLRCSVWAEEKGIQIEERRTRTANRKGEEIRRGFNVGTIEL